MQGEHEHHEQKNEHSHTPPGSPRPPVRILAAASPEKVARVSALLPAAAFDAHGFGHAGPSLLPGSPSSSSSFPRRLPAKAALRTRTGLTARRALLAEEPFWTRPPLERRAHFDDGEPAPRPLSPSSPSTCPSTPGSPSTPPGTPASGPGGTLPIPGTPPALLLASSNANGNRLMVSYDAYALTVLQKLHPKHILGASQRAAIEEAGTPWPRNPPSHILAHGLAEGGKVNFSHPWVKGKECPGVRREFCSLQTYRREVRGLLFGGRYTEVDLINCQPTIMLSWAAHKYGLGS